MGNCTKASERRLVEGAHKGKDRCVEDVSESNNRYRRGGREGFMNRNAFSETGGRELYWSLIARGENKIEHDCENMAANIDMTREPFQKKKKSLHAQLKK